MHLHERIVLTLATGEVVLGWASIILGGSGQRRRAIEVLEARTPPDIIATAQNNLRKIIREINI